jgi:hypothetical protein
MNEIENFYKDLHNKKNKKENTLLDNLYKKPKRDIGKNATTFAYPVVGYYQQADILYLPNDKGYMYALVVVDQGNRLCDAEPLKSKQSEDVLNAFKKIYKRNILIKPEIITTDQGTEFKGETEKGLKAIGIGMSFAKVGRHRQVGLVERKNQTIGKDIHKFILHNTLASGKASSSWIESLPSLIKIINDETKSSLKKNPPKEISHRDPTLELLQEGENVRVMLDNPEDINGNQLVGKFRSHDIRYNPTIRTIKYILIRPDQPPMYLLNGNDSSLKVELVGYTRNQLQLVDENEIKPTKSLTKVEENRYEFEKIIGEKVIGTTKYYLVKWKGYKKSEATWEKRSELIKDVPQAIKRYEN